MQQIRPDALLLAECMREELAPIALTAFPEAYESFKQATLLLLYNQEHARSPVTDLWARRHRTNLAGQLARTIRQVSGTVTLICCSHSIPGLYDGLRAALCPPHQHCSTASSGLQLSIYDSCSCLLLRWCCLASWLFLQH